MSFSIEERFPTFSRTIFPLFTRAEAEAYFQRACAEHPAALIVLFEGRREVARREPAVRA